MIQILKIATPLLGREWDRRWWGWSEEVAYLAGVSFGFVGYWLMIL